MRMTLPPVADASLLSGPEQPELIRAETLADLHRVRGLLDGAGSFSDLR